MQRFPNLDLFNFIEPETSDCEYILTSPRSLKACSHLGIKPIELLPKTKEEFEEEYGSFTKNIDVLYKKFEKDRLKKLRQCRREREQIAEDNNKEFRRNYVEYGEDKSYAVDIQNDVTPVIATDLKKTRAPRRTIEKPSIISYLNAKDTNPPPVKSFDTQLKTEADDFKFSYSLDDCHTLKNVSLSKVYAPYAAENRAKYSNEERSQSQREIKKSRTGLSLEDAISHLPLDLKNKISHLSPKDRKMIDMYITRVNREQLENYDNLSKHMQTLNFAISSGQGSKTSEMSSEKKKKGKSAGKKVINIEPLMLQYDNRKISNNIMEEHTALLNDIEEKHRRAGEAFQQRMKQKEYKRELKKMKQLDRKEFQERQLQDMETNLKVWQEELQELQRVNAERATKVVEKRNAITSAKIHSKRLQKQMDHAAMRSKLEEEEKLRQEELRAMISMKDERSNLINNEKAEYAKAGREAAQLTRTIKQCIKEQTINSSFDRMAANAKRIARLEQLSEKKNDTLSLDLKNRSNLLLG